MTVKVDGKSTKTVKSVSGTLFKIVTLAISNTDKIDTHTL